ncbi:MAG TPA: glycosyltransferase family 4 protein, partial [Candidatus Eisenbacteria bacterium]
VAGHAGSPPLVEARRRGLQVLDAFDFRQGRLDIPWTLGRFRRYLGKSHFDVVNAHRADDHVVAALALERNGPPLVRTRGDVRPPRRHLLNRWLYERLTSTHVMAAEFMRTPFYSGFSIPAEKLVTIRPGLDVDAWREGAGNRWNTRDGLAIPRGARLVGVIGRLAEAKGHLVALEAFARLARRFPEARLVIAGAPEELTPALLNERAQHLGIDRVVKLLPRQDDIRPLMAALDVGLIASTASEAICRVALEYQALGIPVVGSDLNSIPEMVVHGKTGLIVPPGDPAAVALSLERLFTEPSLADRLGAAGPDHVRKLYGLKTMVDRTEALYRKLIRENAGD